MLKMMKSRIAYILSGRSKSESLTFSAGRIWWLIRVGRRYAFPASNDVITLDHEDDGAPDDDPFFYNEFCMQQRVFDAVTCQLL